MPIVTDNPSNGPPPEVRKEVLMPLLKKSNIPMATVAGQAAGYINKTSSGDVSQGWRGESNLQQR